MPEEEELVRIAKKLEKITARNDSSSPAQALNLLQALETMPVTLELIGKTRIGLTVNNLRRSINDEDVSNLSKGLIKKWKKMLGDKEAGKGTPATAASSNAAATAKVRPMETDNITNSDSSSNDKSINGNGSKRNGVADSSSASKVVSPSGDAGKNGRKNLATLAPPRQMAFPKVSTTGDEVRLKCREMLANALKPDANTEGNDTEIFFDHVELANAIEESIFREFKDTNPRYKTRIRSRVANLRDVKNPDLKLNVLKGIIKPEKIAIMTAEEMASTEMKQLRQKFTKEAINDAQMSLTGGTKTDLLKCPNCKKSNCTYNQVQTRSADEPMTTFCFCNECGKRWKFC